MGVHREAMRAEMQLRGFAPRTQRTYTHWMKRLVTQVRMPADQLTEQQARGFLTGLSARRAVGFDDQSGDQRGTVFLSERAAATVGSGDSLSACAIPGAGDADAGGGVSPAGSSPQPA